MENKEKTIIKEEINYIKYLFEYQKGKVVSEQMTPPSPTPPPTRQNQDMNAKKPEGVTGEKSPQELMKDASYEICSKNENQERCRSCGEVAKNLELGKLREKEIESCLECKKKTGTDYLKCDELKGQLLAASGKLSTEKKGVETKTSAWVLLGSTLLTLFKDIKSMFTNDSNQGPM